jgi:hypothetical protein
MLSHQESNSQPPMATPGELAYPSKPALPSDTMKHHFT